MNQRFTAHDVRKLRLCAICGGLGHMDRLLTLPGWPRGNLYHGECAVRMLDRAEVLALPESELRKLTLADTGMDLMRDMVDQICKPANVEFSGVPAGHSINNPAGGTSAATQG